MAKIIYRINFYDFWHTSSGLSTGTDVDLTVIKDNNNLPFLPGKTLKGLLREAAETLNFLNKNLVTQEFIIDLFGEKVEESNRKNSYMEALSFFSDAYLPKSIYEFVEHGDSNSYSKAFYNTIASTKIDENGQAEEHSLRQMEVTIPIQLYAKIIDFPEKTNYLEQLKHCFSYIKRIGLNRNRGLGRCKFEIVNS